MSSFSTSKPFYDGLQLGSSELGRKSMPSESTATKEPYHFAYNPEKQMEESVRLNYADVSSYRFSDRLAGSADRKPSQTQRYGLQYHYHTNSGLKANPYLQQIQVGSTLPDSATKQNPYASSFHKLRPNSNIQNEPLEKYHRPTMSALDPISQPKNMENYQSCLDNIPPLPLQQRINNEESKRNLTRELQNPHHANIPSSKPVISLGKSSSAAKNLALAKPIAVAPVYFEEKFQNKPVSSDVQINEAATERKYNFLHSMDTEKLKQENRQLSREVFNLKAAKNNQEVEYLRSRIAQLQADSKSKESAYNNSVNNLQNKAQQISQELEAYRKRSGQTIQALRQQIEQFQKQHHTLKEQEKQTDGNKQMSDQAIKNMQKQAQQQKELVQDQLRIAQQKQQNMLIELNYQKQQHSKFKLEAESLRSKLREQERLKDWEDEAQDARQVLEDKIAQLAGSLQQQKTEHQRAVSKNHEYEREIKAFRDQIGKLDKDNKALQQQNSDFKHQISDIKAQTKNLLSLSRRSSGSLQDSRSYEEKHSLVQQLAQKIEQIGQLKKKIGHMAIELSQFQEKGEHAQLRDRVVKLEAENQKLRKRSNSTTHFDDILKVQLTETQQYKQTLNSKTEIILQLREELKVASMEIDQLRREIEVDRLKKTIEKKNLQAQQNIEKEARKAQVEKLKSSIRGLQEKAKHWSGECQRKDEFIQNHLLSKITKDADRNSINQFFKQFSTSFKAQ